QRVEIPMDEFEETEHHASPSLRVGRRPGRLCGSGHRDCVLDLGTRREGDPRLHVAGIGVEHVAEPARCALELLAAHKVTDFAHVSLLVSTDDKPPCSRLPFHMPPWDRKRNMANHPIRCLHLLALAAALASSQATAQPSGALNVETVANYAGADRQKVLEAGARREGSLLLYTTGTQIKPLIDRFEQIYPYVKIELA